jgi:hypothetical protein
MSLVELKAPSKAAAPGQYLGFSLQQVRLCYHLLRVPDGASVSLEYMDDVAVHGSDGYLTLEQDKSALSGNPASDRSEELWKTFANWADLCAGGLDPSTASFVLYVTPAKVGDVVMTLHSAVEAEAVSNALAKVKSLFNSKKPDVGCNPYIKRFIDAGDLICRAIIHKFNLITEDDPIEGIRQQLRSVIRTETLNEFSAAAIGIARERADTLIRKNEPAIILAVEFRRQFHSFVRKYDLLGLLISSAPAPSADAIAAIVNIAPLFVRQLEAVEASADLLVTAVSDYLRTETDKVDWADEGLIFANSLDELDGQLERQHTIARDEVEDMMASVSEVRRGRALYRKCVATQLPLEGRTLPSHFIAGAYNSLADGLRVGWHPNYQHLFSETDI